MPIANCKRCGRMFNRVRRDICPSCVAEEENMFQAVRKYLRDHRNASMSELVEATEIPMEFIVEMIRDGRIILRDNPNLTYECERCGQPTQSGRYCAKCTQELAAGLSGAATEVRKHKDDSRKNSGYYSKN